ncbi:hypothetical protein A2U01_0059969, partial [Trifolium medium]|nr:hypothetical protein [Trifolium medium]
GCPEKKKEAVANNERRVNEGQAAGNNTDGSDPEGPWRIVQKQKRNKKAATGRNNTTAGVNATPAKLNDPANSGGSRFGVLSV